MLFSPVYHKLMTFLLGSKTNQKLQKIVYHLRGKGYFAADCTFNWKFTFNEKWNKFCYHRHGIFTIPNKKVFYICTFLQLILVSFTTVASNSSYNIGNGRELQQQLTTTCYRDWIMSSPTTFGHIKSKFSLSNFKIELFSFLDERVTNSN